MAKFRKKPVIVDAVQFHNGVQIPGLCGCLTTPGAVMHQRHVHTLEGLMNVKQGDWIVTGIKGEKYPVKDEIFRATYEEVKDAGKIHSGE